MGMWEMGNGKWEMGYGGENTIVYSFLNLRYEMSPGAATTAMEKAVAWRVGRRLEGLRPTCVLALAWGTANGVTEKTGTDRKLKDCVSARKDVRFAET